MITRRIDEARAFNAAGSDVRDEACEAQLFGTVSSCADIGTLSGTGCILSTQVDTTGADGVEREDIYRLYPKALTLVDASRLLMQSQSPQIHLRLPSNPLQEHVEYPISHNTATQPGVHLIM